MEEIIVPTIDGCTEDVKPYICTICNGAFPVQYALQQHACLEVKTIVKNESEDPVSPNDDGLGLCETTFKCDECGAEFATLGSLNTHKRFHLGPKLYKCKLCSNDCVEKDGLSCPSQCQVSRRTLRASSSKLGSQKQPSSSHTEIEILLKCKLCDATFKEERTLRVHSRTHAVINLLKCEFCDSQFKQRVHLVEHMRTHTGERPYKCGECGAAFARPKNLQAHSRTHSGEKPFKCKLCDSAFTQLSGLHRHALTHTGEKPYKCDVCDDAFSQISSLKRHVRIHTGEKPFKCVKCSAAFTQSRSLKRHNCYGRRAHVSRKLLQQTL